MKVLSIAETYSTPDRIEANSRRMGNAHYLVLPDGAVKPLVKANGHEEVVVVLPKGKAGDRIFTAWEMSYVVPPLEQLESLWDVVQVLAADKKMLMTFAGQVGESFRWGWIERPVGVAARARVALGQGGLLPEFYCLARSRGMPPEPARAEAIARAKENVGATLLPALKKKEPESKKKGVS